MPSGLTYKINSGEDMTLRGFALKCVTQLGAGYFATCQGEKEMPLDKAPVLKVSNYHQEQLSDAEKDIAFWNEVKDNQREKQKLYDEYIQKKRSEDIDRDKRQAAIKERYITMIKKVEAWNLPDEYKSLKDLMLKQLNDSLDFDCPERNRNEERLPTIDEWLKCQIESAEWSIEYHTKEYEKEKAHTEDINKYLKGLYDEIDKVEPIQK